MDEEKSKLQEAIDLLEEIATSIGGMMDVQPINLAGEEMPSKVEKEKRNTTKTFDKRYKVKTRVNKKIK